MIWYSNTLWKHLEGKFVHQAVLGVKRAPQPSSAICFLSFKPRKQSERNARRLQAYRSRPEPNEARCGTVPLGPSGTHSTESSAGEGWSEGRREQGFVQGDTEPCDVWANPTSRQYPWTSFGGFQTQQRIRILWRTCLKYMFLAPIPRGSWSTMKP